MKPCGLALSILVVVGLLILPAAVLNGQETLPLEPDPDVPLRAAPEGAGQPDVATAPEGDVPPLQSEFPYVGELTGDNVYLRSGPGRHFYTLDKLKIGKKVVVEDKKWNWIAVRLVGDVSGLIAKKNVERGAGGAAAKVTAEEARVYASSATAKRKWAVLAILEAGDEVQILGELGDLYRIVPPQMSRVYISADYIKRVGPYPEAWQVVKVVKIDLVILKKDPQEAEFKKIRGRLEKELEKPPAERKLDQFIKPFTSVAKKAKSTFLKDDALRQVAWLKSQIVIQEKHRKVDKLAEDLKKKLEAIDEAAGKPRTLQEALADKYDVWGTIEKMVIFEGTASQVKFKLLDDKGRVRVLLTSKEHDLGKFVGKRVGLKGLKSYHAEWRIYIVDVVAVELLGGGEAAPEKKE
ncbi:MAG: hypothetical protein QGD94_04280 [Planctomycetia bacterium]|nr:hypothetical protein [Planctomycetia bacterium]